MLVLPGNNGPHLLDIPAGCSPAILTPSSVDVPSSFAALLLEALAHPLGCGPLVELVRPSHKILIISDDNTRTTPVHQVLPLLLAELVRAGCRPSDLTLAVALGTHRCLTPAEIELKLGRDAVSRFPVINDPAGCKGAFVPTGQSFGGVPVEVHRAVLDADFVIAIGSVVPHTEAGWSGGCKMILPGMCSERTVMANHRLAADYPGNALGQSDTPVRRSMEEIVARIGFDFSINLVLTAAGGVLGVFAGHFVAAQRAAAAAARRVYAVPFRERADIVVSNAYPAEVDFWQGSKAIFSGQLLLKPGGTLVLNAPCHEGVGPHPDFLRFVQDCPDELRAGLASGSLADVTAAALALPIARMLDNMRLLIVSPGLPAGQFLGRRVVHHVTLDAALADALSAAPAGARRPCQIGVLTHGGCTFPIPALA